MFCPNCGKEIVVSGSFCVNCGAKLPEALRYNAPSPAQPAPPVQPAQPTAPVQPAQSAAQPVREPQPAPVPQSVREPEPQPAREPIPAPPSQKPAPEPKAEPTQQPVQQPVRQPIHPPAQQPAPQPVQQPVQQSTVPHVQQPGPQQAPPYAQPYPPKPAQPPKPPKPQKKRRTGLIIAIAVVAVLAIAAAIILLPKLIAPKGGDSAPGNDDKGSISKDVGADKERTYDLADYLKLEYTGMDGEASVFLELDREKLMRDVCADWKIDPVFLNESVPIPEEILPTYEAIMNADALIVEADDFIYYGPDGKGLKNGDTFTASIIYHEGTTEPATIEITDAVVTVSGLEVMPEADPFEGLSIRYEEGAISGDNFVDLVYEGPIQDLDSAYFIADPMFDVNNGDVITVKIEMDEATFTQLFKVKPTTLEKQYTAEGLPVKVTSFDQIPKPALEHMKELAAEAAKEELQKLDQLSFKVSYTEPVCIGYEFLYHPDDSVILTSNALLLVMRSEVSYPDADHVPETFFFRVGFDDVTDSEDDAGRNIDKYWDYSRTTIAGMSLLGISDPWEYFQEDADRDPDVWTVSFGGEVATYSKGGGVIDAPSDISDAALSRVVDYAAAAIGKIIVEDGGSDPTAPLPLGFYLIKATNSSIPDARILVLMFSVSYRDAGGREMTRYVPYELDEVSLVKNALVVKTDVGPMYDPDDIIGYSSFRGFHEALLATANRFGEISYNDSIAALVG